MGHLVIVGTQLGIGDECIYIALVDLARGNSLVTINQCINCDLYRSRRSLSTHRIIVEVGVNCGTNCQAATHVKSAKAILSNLIPQASTIIPMSQVTNMCLKLTLLGGHASINIAHAIILPVYIKPLTRFCDAWLLVLVPSRLQVDRRNGNKAANPTVKTRPSQKDTIQTMAQKTTKLPPLRHGDNGAHGDLSGHYAPPRVRRGNEKPPTLACLPLE